MFTENFVEAVALIGIVILVASLLSGVVERTGLPQVAIFLGLGAVLGPAGLNLVELTLDSPAVQVIATLGLVLVLFTDAITVEPAELREHRTLAAVVLGPGTLIPAAVIFLAGWLLLDLAPLHAAILGAALASTDPVLLRSFLRQPRLTRTARTALRLESGMNDVVLLPIVATCILAIGTPREELAGELASHAIGLFLLGPALGALAGYIAITLLDQIRKRVGVRRDYESLYALGVALTAFAAAESVGGSGFLAAFAAGVVIAAMDVELCDCFLDYGQATAEMFLLLTFVAFGASLIWSGVTVADAPTLAFAVIALMARTLVLLPVLSRTGLDVRDRRIIAWFGPRGLSSLLLVLLPVFAGIPGSDRLFAITSLVVLLSVVFHGTGIAFFLRKVTRGNGPLAATPLPERIVTGPTLNERVPERITLEELHQLREAGEPVVLADVRTERSYRDDNLIAEGAIRLPPDEAVQQARELGLDKRATIVLYCT
ncbi:MAG TPA: cation:proton antiporter [Gemmatimonadales bacterium]|nr:cation:proton antiporter [Gemmatimonadales bacterium]